MPKKSEGSAEGALSIQVPVEFLCLTEVIAELEKDMLAVEAGIKNYAEVEQKIAEVHEKIAQVAVQTLKNRLNHEPTMPVPRAMMHLIPTLRRVLESLATSLEGVPSDGSAVDYADFEHVVAQQLRCVEQAMHASMLQKLDVDSDAVRIWGSAYKRVGRYEGEYYCLAGPVRVMRSIYRKVGDRHGKTIDAVSLRSGAVADGWLPRTAQAMAHLLAQGTSREAQTISAELLRLPYSRSSFERVGHEVAKRYRQGHPRIETGLIEAYEVPDETKSVSVSIDRVSLPMEELPPPVSPRSASIDKALADLRASGPRTRDVDARTQANIYTIRAQSDKHNGQFIWMLRRVQAKQRVGFTKICSQPDRTAQLERQRQKAPRPSSRCRFGLAWCSEKSLAYRRCLTAPVQSAAHACRQPDAKTCGAAGAASDETSRPLAG